MMIRVHFAMKCTVPGCAADCSSEIDWFYGQPIPWPTIPSGWQTIFVSTATGPATDQGYAAVRCPAHRVVIDEQRGILV